VSPSMASLFPETRDLRRRLSGNYLVAALASRTGPILQYSPTRAPVLQLTWTRLFSRHKSVLLSALYHPAITYLPKSGDWVFDKLRGCYNNTIQWVLHSQTLSSLRRCIPSSSALPKQGEHKLSWHLMAKRLPSMGRCRQSMRTTWPIVFIWA